MDYSKLSDAEINMRVAEIIYPGKKFTEAYSFGYPDGPMVQWVQGYAEHLKLDYCNNPTDAWPIILANKIGILWLESEKLWSANSPGELEEGCWDWSCTPGHWFDHSNPLRAAMIVFLMMQESER